MSLIIKMILFCLLYLLFFLIETESKLYPLKIFKENKNLVSKYTIGKLRNLNSDSNSIMTDLYGDSDYLNYYYVEVYLGKKEEKTTLIVDTGSSLMCLTCSSTCTHCGKHENPHFQSDKSESFRILSCEDSQCSPFKNYKSCNKDKCAFSIVRFL